MRSILPPIPRDDNIEVRTDWLNRLRSAILNISSSITWSVLDKTGSNLIDIETKSHNDLDNLQGGSTGQRYHLTSTQSSAIASFNATQWTDLTDSGENTLHYHDSDRARANHTGTQLLSTISDAGTAASQSGLSVTITTAKLTALGANGSMTFVNGVLTGQTAAT